MTNLHALGSRVPRVRAGPTDAELLRLLDAADAPEAEEPDELPAPVGDPCAACGEPAQNLGLCHVCEEEGCLPPDVWTPGMADACLTLCVRCARTIHLGCAGEDAAGNPACPTCRF